LAHAEILATADGQAPQKVLPGRCMPYVIDRADLVDGYQQCAHGIATRTLASNTALQRTHFRTAALAAGFKTLGRP
jgi:hypothetical protein